MLGEDDRLCLCLKHRLWPNVHKCGTAKLSSRSKEAVATFGSEGVRIQGPGARVDGVTSLQKRIKKSKVPGLTG